VRCALPGSPPSSAAFGSAIAFWRGCHRPDLLAFGADQDRGLALDPVGCVRSSAFQGLRQRHRVVSQQRAALAPPELAANRGTGQHIPLLLVLGQPRLSPSRC
jgi:hypothetical protein